MQLSIPYFGARQVGRQSLGWLLAAALGAALWAPLAPYLVRTWQTDSAVSHGPLILLLALAHLWMRRKELGEWSAASPAGLLFLVLSASVHVLSTWAEIEFFRPLSLIMMTVGVFWFLGGLRAFKAAVGPLGFLVFMIPWPTTLVERLAFPLQLTSSAYAGLMGGLLGLPIVREGVQMAIIPDRNAPPVYSMVVAQQCSGLTSLMVLLALGYLIAYHTPKANLGWRALLVLLVVPLTLLTNSIRLTFILLAGGHGSPQLAQWVHDHEAPFLIFLCSLGLMGLRQGLLAWLEREPAPETPHDEPVPVPGA